MDDKEEEVFCNGWSSGIYLVQLKDANDQLVGTNKIMVK